MSDGYTRGQIENWASDFTQSDAASAFSPGVREYASQVLSDLLERACSVHGRAPGDLGRDDLLPAYDVVALGGGMPDSVAERVPDLCAAFLAFLQAEGRLAEGRRIGMELRARKPRRARTPGGGAAPERRPGPKVELNGPCPCGSGRKFKKCCRVV